MTTTHLYDGNTLVGVRRGSVELTSAANIGAVGQGRLTIVDKNGTTSIVGQKHYRVTESACAVPEVYDGFMEAREYHRGMTTAGMAREIDCTVEDRNQKLGHRLVYRRGSMDVHEGGKRPREKISDRGAWLMGHHAMNLIADNGRCDFPNDVWMDKADYRNQFPGDVLQDMALAAGGFNFYVRDFGSGDELVFRDDNVSTADSSDIRISNDQADRDEVTFYPFKDARLRRVPSRVVSLVAMTHKKGTVYEERDATAEAFNGERGVVMSNSHLDDPASATRAARRALREFKTEEDEIEVTIQVPRESCNLVNQGDRMQVKFTHLATEGYGDFTWMRVLQITKRILLKAVPKYELTLTLSPQEDAAAGEIACPYEATPGGIYYPLGGYHSADVPPTPNLSDGPVYYCRPGVFYPSAPMENHQGSWHFGLYGNDVWGEVQPGGEGTIDWAGDCAMNTIRFIIVAPDGGTMTINTAIFEGSPRNFDVFSYSMATGVATDAEYVGRFTSGTPVEVEIPADCDRIVDLTNIGGQWSSSESCGGKIGFTSMVWEPA